MERVFLATSVYDIDDKGSPDWGWDGPGWYFWDETDAYAHGPFSTKEEAKEAQKHYGEELDNERQWGTPGIFYRFETRHSEG